MIQIYFNYVVCAIVQLLCMVFCYLTNWFVVLFADETGELPKVFKLWQTWDSSLDNRTYIMEDASPFLRYDFDTYYETDIEDVGNGREKKIVRVKKPFPLRLRFKRYLARVFWLYRNCGYGFAYYLFGIDTKADTIVKVSPYYSYCSNAFRYKRDTPISKHWRWCIYLGWKYDFHKDCHAMIATRIQIKRLK